MTVYDLYNVFPEYTRIKIKKYGEEHYKLTWLALAIDNYTYDEIVWMRAEDINTLQIILAAD